MVRRVAVGLHALLAELLDELAVACELQHQTVGTAVAADPDKAFGISKDAVVRVGPVVARTGSAKGMQHIASLVELDDGRRLLAARTSRWVLVGSRFDGVKRVVAMNDPDMVLIVGPDTNGLADVPAVWQRLGPHRIDFEPGR